MEKYLKRNSNFIKLNNDVSIDKLNTLINKKVYVDLLEKNGIISEYLELVSVNNSIIRFKKDDSYVKYNISDIKGIEELINYNNNNIVFEEYLGKEIILTDLHNEKEQVEIEYIVCNDLCLRFLFENNDGTISETRDYPWPKHFVKKIELI